MVYKNYMVCVTCVLIEQLVPALPPKKLKWRQTSPNGDGLPQVVLRGCFAAKNSADIFILENIGDSNDSIFNICRHRCARNNEQSLLFDLLKAFYLIESSHKSIFFIVRNMFCSESQSNISAMA